MLHTLKKGEYPEGHRYWSNATADLTAPDGRDIGPEELPVQLRRVLDDLWSDGYGVECYLVEWDVDADAFHEVADWLDSRCRFNE